jgi:hypothetical protein
MSECNPLGSGAGLVDQRLGNAYQVVKHVYDNLAAIIALAGKTDGLNVLSDNYAMMLAGVTNFRATYAEAISEFPIGTYFTSAQSGQLRLYQIVNTTPYYEDQGDIVAPLTRLALAATSGAALVGSTAPQGATVEDALENAVVAFSTPANMLNKANAINVTKKYLGKLVHNTTDHKLYVALAATDIGGWQSVDGLSIITPV